MKREYVKPTIYFESFALSTNIAGDCAITTDLPSNEICGMETDAFVIFVTSMNGCELQVTLEDGWYDGICYDVPVDGKNLFNS